MKIPNIHFVCCSDVASAVDMSEFIVSELTSLEADGVEAYDVSLQQEVVVLSPLLCILADNPVPLNSLTTLKEVQEDIA